ncbi:hypothetical protein HDF18_15810 [Mucilaginibacter sp. X5P1]|nr:hypothetical protein [Mucilaginibacter sp. X5P1]MBB6139088.1 hypothetical protein [Mucilaginibacter sp. X5P1]
METIEKSVEALNNGNGLSGDLKNLITQQQAEITNGHDKIKYLRDG